MLTSLLVVSQFSTMGFGYSLTKLGTKACLTPRAGVSLNVDIAEVDTPEDPVIEKTIAVCQSTSVNGSVK